MQDDTQFDNLIQAIEAGDMGAAVAICDDLAGNATYLEKSSHFYDASPQISWCLILHGLMPDFEIATAIEYASFGQDDWCHVIENNGIKFKTISRLVIRCLLANRIDEACLILNAYFVQRSVSAKDKKKIFRQLTVEAVQNYCCNMFRLLRKFDVQYNDMSDKYWQSLLIQCIELDVDEQCGYLLEIGVKPHIVLIYPHEMPESLCKAFSLVCKYGRMTMLEGMLQAWSLPSSIIHREIGIAIKEQNSNLLETFLQSPYLGAGIKIDLIRRALHADDSQFLKYLLDHGLDPDVEFVHRPVALANMGHFCLFDALFSEETPQYEDDDFDNITVRFLCALQLLSRPYDHYADLHDLGRALFITLSRMEDINEVDEADLLASMDTNVILFMSSIGFSPILLLIEYIEQCDDPGMIEWANLYTGHFVEKALLGLIGFMNDVIGWDQGTFYKDVHVTHGEALPGEMVVDLTVVLQMLGENHNQYIAALSQQALELWQEIIHKATQPISLKESAFLQAMSEPGMTYDQIAALPDAMKLSGDTLLSWAFYRRGQGEMMMPMQLIAQEYLNQYYDQNEDSTDTSH